MLNQLRKNWIVVIGTSVTEEPMIELIPLGANLYDFEARYVEPKLEDAIRRAWAGEPSDG